jgi:hypothetical protein
MSDEERSLSAFGMTEVCDGLTRSMGMLNSGFWIEEKRKRLSDEERSLSAFGMTEVCDGLTMRMEMLNFGFWILD